MLETPLQSQQSQQAHQPATTLPDPFVFVPITRQEAAKGRGAAKRIVRAHVTRVQHAKSSTLSGSQDLQTWMVKPYIHRDNASNRRKTRTLAQSGKRRANGLEEEDEPSTGPRQKSVALVPRLPTGSAGDDPFWTYPVEYQPYLSPIFAHCQCCKL